VGKATTAAPKQANIARAARDLIIWRLLTVAVSRSRCARGSLHNSGVGKEFPQIQLIFEIDEPFARRSLGVDDRDLRRFTCIPGEWLLAQDSRCSINKKAANFSAAFLCVSLLFNSDRCRFPRLRRERGSQYRHVLRIRGAQYNGREDRGSHRTRE
jgi:hypothetical protein